MVLESIERAELRRFLAKRFDLSELKDLAFDLGVDYQMFQHETIGDFARELIAYFERRNNLSCLVIEIMRHRPHNDLEHLLGSLPPCPPSKKIQIFVSGDLLEDVSKLLRELTAELGLADDELALVGMASGSVRLLISLHKKLADLQVLSKIHLDGERRQDVSIVLFDSLDQASQKAWRRIVCNHPPKRYGNVLRPTVSWQVALEEVRAAQLTPKIPTEQLRVLKQVIIANAKFWLDYLNTSPEGVLVPEPDIRGAARALEAVMTASEAWLLTQALALALHPYVERQGYWTDWEGFLQGLVTLARRREDWMAEAELLARQGDVQHQRGDYEAAVLSYRRMWRLCRRAGDQLGRARALANLGNLYRLQGHFRSAETLCQGALVLFESLEDTARLAYTENHLGLVYFDQRCWADALPHLVRSKALLEQLGDRHFLAKTLQNLGDLYRRTGDLDVALDCFRQAIHHYQAVGDEIHTAQTQLNIGNVYLNQSDLLRAEQAYSQAEIALKHLGDSLNLARVRHNLGIVYTRLENWIEAESCFERALEQWRSLGDTWNLANTWGELAALYLARGCWVKARACLDKVEELVNDRPEAHYGSLQRELAERRQALHRLAGLG